MSKAAFDPGTFCVEGVRELKPYEPGKPISELQRELGTSDIVKLASNENPFGPSPRALEAMRAELGNVALYPDGNAFALKQALASYHGIEANRITVGTGSDHILELIGRVFLGPGRSAVMSRYAFLVYSIVTRAAGAQLRVADAYEASHAEQPYGHDVEALLAEADDTTRVVFVANPNNPTGTWLKRVELADFLARVSPDTIVVVDEAYYDYVAPYERDYPDTRALLEQYSNLIVLRTFSKAYGLAGVRVGYALASTAVTDYLNRVRLAFNPNSLGQAAAVAALEDRAHIRHTVEVNRRELKRVGQTLRAMGLETIPSVCNFVTADVRRSGRDVFQEMLGKGVIVRPLDGYGLPTHLRLSIGLPEQNDRLIHVLRDVLGS